MRGKSATSGFNYQSIGVKLTQGALQQVGIDRVQLD